MPLRLVWPRSFTLGTLYGGVPHHSELAALGALAAYPVAELSRKPRMV